MGRAFASLGYNLLHGKVVGQSVLDLLQIDKPLLNQILKNRNDNPGSPLCLISGGETIVKVKGKGKGGRNQELALSAALFLHSLQKISNDSGQISFLSAGTDGIDGPTDVAGAIIDNYTIEHAEKQGLNATQHLENNDSYNFFLRFNDGVNFVKTGHTGTNVMDIQLLLIQPLKGI